MSEMIYAVLLHVRATQLSTVIQVLEKSAVLVSVTPTTPDQTQPPEKKTFRYANGVRFKGISGRDLVLQILTANNGLCDNEQLEKAFVKAGFAKDSYSGPISYLITEGRVRRLDRGRVALVGTTIHKGASE
jgi:hypothetical protein